MKAFSISIVATKLIAKELKKKGIILNNDQMARLEKQLKKRPFNNSEINLGLNEEQERIIKNIVGEKLTINLGNEKELNDLFHDYLLIVKDEYPKMVEETTRIIYSSAMRNMKYMLRNQRKMIKGLIKRLKKDWGKPLDLIEAYIKISYEAGDEFNQTYRKEAAESQDFIFEVLTRLHARACQIASEVLVLLENGFADGAHARWRTIHEIAVVASFIKEFGNEVAERYLLYENIESYRASLKYQEHYQALGDDPFPQHELNSMKETYEDLIQRFGDSFSKPYGWASSVFGDKPPKFADIEKLSELSHWRPYYKLASNNIHADPKGIMFKLGLLGNPNDILLAGPSNMGLTDPAHGTVISLGIITTTLINTRPTFDSIVISNILLSLQTQIGEECLKVQRSIEKREKKYSK